MRVTHILLVAALMIILICIWIVLIFVHTVVNLIFWIIRRPQHLNTLIPIFVNILVIFVWWWLFLRSSYSALPVDSFFALIMTIWKLRTCISIFAFTLKIFFIVLKATWVYLLNLLVSYVLLIRYFSSFLLLSIF